MRYVVPLFFFFALNLQQVDQLFSILSRSRSFFSLDVRGADLNVAWYFRYVPSKSLLTVERFRSRCVINFKEKKKLHFVTLRNEDAVLSCTLPNVSSRSRKRRIVYSPIRAIVEFQTISLFDRKIHSCIHIWTHICIHINNTYVYLFTSTIFRCDAVPEAIGAFHPLFTRIDNCARVTSGTCSAEEKIANEKCWLKELTFRCVTCVSIRVKMMHQCCTKMIAEKIVRPLLDQYG